MQTDGIGIRIVNVTANLALLGSVLPSAYATHGPDLSRTSIIRNLPALDVSGNRAHYQEKSIAVPIFYLPAAHR